MPAQSLQTDVFILSKRPPSESFELLTAFSPVSGALTVLQRVAKKSATAAISLDLFDEAALLLETSNQGQTWFIKDARLLARRTGIGGSYDCLRYAAAFAQVVARNPTDEASRESVADLLRTAFAAFETSDRPDIVYFKGLYRFARDEGYPVKEQWFPTLPSADRAAVTELINRPLAEQIAPKEIVSRLQQRLEEYLRGHTEILVG